jgi:hypothetical protein
MKPPDDAPGQPLDDLDFEILDDIRALFDRVDPMPAGLPERVRLALALRGLESEVARLAVEEGSRLVGARGADQNRTLAFDSASLSIIVRTEENKDGSVRIDGWLAPPRPREIEMLTSAGTLSASSDGQGRFAFAEVPPGSARLVVLAATASDQGDGGPAVVTPAFVL